MILKNKSFTLTELLTASVMAVLLIGSVFGVFLTTRAVFTKNLEAAGLQRDANTILQNIIRGKQEGANITGLRSATSFIIPVTDPAGSEIDFTGVDGQTRKWFLSGGSIVYESPAQLPTQKTIYTAAADCSITLRFWEPPGYVDHETVGIYISISKQTASGPVSGSMSTYVNLKNVPK